MLSDFEPRNRAGVGMKSVLEERERVVRRSSLVFYFRWLLSRRMKPSSMNLGMLVWEFQICSANSLKLQNGLSSTAAVTSS